MNSSFFISAAKYGLLLSPLLFISVAAVVVFLRFWKRLEKMLSTRDQNE